MDFSVIDETAEVAAFRKDVREWLAENMKGSENLRWSASWSTRENEEEYRFRRALGLKLGEKGWLYPMFPKEYGGGGLTVHHQLVLAAEIGRYGMSLDHVFYTLARLVAPCMLHWATEEQKAAFLPPLLKGEIISWQVLTEPQGGSDLATCRTYAVRDGDHYVINGQKTMVGSTHDPDYLWTIVNTAPDKPRHENLSWIYIPGNLPGITYHPMQLMMGRKNAIFFDDVRVPAFNLVGGENNGWKVANTHLELEHGGDGGLESTNTMERLIDYCKKTGINGSSILEDDKVRETLADIYIELHAAQLFAQRNFFFRYIREPHPYGGVQFRYYNRMVRLRNSARLQQILGFDALIPNHDINEDDDFEYLIRSGPGKLHGGGTLDTDRLIFARRLGLGRPHAEKPPVTV